MRCMKVRLRRVSGRPLAVLQVRVSTVAIQVHVPVVSGLRRDASSHRSKIPERDFHLYKPIAVAIGIIVKRARVGSGNLDTLGVPDRRPGLLWSMGTKVVDVSTDYIPLDIEVDVRRGRIWRQHNFEAIVLG